MSSSYTEPQSYDLDGDFTDGKGVGYKMSEKIRKITSAAMCS